MDSIILSVEHEVAIIYLNEPDRLNSLSDSIKKSLFHTLSLISDRSDVKAVILAGKGKSFCAGGDLKGLSSVKTPNEIEKNMRYTGDIIKKIYHLNKPVIACVHGYAAGAGFSIALSADMIIAEESAKFKLAFKNIGLVPDLGLHYFLPRIVGPWKAKELIWRGATISAKEAEQIGFVNQIALQGKGVNRALDLAKELASGPANAFLKTKKIINEYGLNELDDVLTIENYSQTILRTSEDFQEGVKAFYEKRAPNFKGK